MKKAVIVLSGGLDSVTAMAIAKDQGYELYALTFDYGQRHSCEMRSATRAALNAGVKEHLVFLLPLSDLVQSACSLTDRTMEVAKDSESKEIPSTYVPSRNLIFMSIAAAWAEAIGAQSIFVGVNAVDYSGYPDCREDFIRAFSTALHRGTKCGVEGRSIKIEAPLLHMTKEQIIRKGTELGVDYSQTHSCYDPVDGLACGRCDSCRLRKRGFEWSGVPDPTRYAVGPKDLFEKKCPECGAELTWNGDLFRCEKCGSVGGPGAFEEK